MVTFSVVCLHVSEHEGLINVNTVRTRKERQNSVKTDCTLTTTCINSVTTYINSVINHYMY